jgi:hypothetical protein
MTWARIPVALGWSSWCSEYAIRHALRKAGFRRYLALKKPPLNNDVKDLRLQWAEIHVKWTIED